MSKQYNVILVGIGAVGAEMLKVLHQRNFPAGEIKILARSTREEEIDGRTPGPGAFPGFGGGGRGGSFGSIPSHGLGGGGVVILYFGGIDSPTWAP